MSLDAINKALQASNIDPSNIDQTSKQSVIYKENVPQINPIASAVMSASDTFTGGLIRPLVAGTTALSNIAQTELGLGKPQQSYLPGGYKKELGQALDATRNVIAESHAQNPLASLGGAIGGFVSPGSISNKVFSGATNLAMRGAPQLAKGAGFLNNLGRTANIIGRNVAGGALGSIATGQMTSNLPYSDVEGRTNEALLQGAIGGITQGALGAISPTAQAAKIGLESPRGQAILDVIQDRPILGKIGRIVNAPKVAELEQQYSASLIDADKKYLAQKASIEAEKRLAKEVQQIDFAKQQQAIKEAKDAALNSVKTFQKADNKTIGQQFSNWFNNKAAKFFDDFQQLKGSVISKYGNSKADVTELKSAINDVLENRFFYKKDVFGKTNIDDILSKNVDPEMASALKTLLKTKDSLENKSFSLKELDLLRRQFQKLAGDYGKKGSEYEQMFKNFAPHIDETFKNNLNNIGGKNAVKEYELANQVYSKNIDVYDALKDIAGTAPENIIKTARSKFTGSFIDTVRSQQPELVNPVKDIILNDIAQNVKNPQQLTKILDTYGRDSLSGLFGPEMWGKVLKTEEVLAKEFARTAVKKDIPQSVLLAKAIKEIPQKPMMPSAINDMLNYATKNHKLLSNGQIQIILNELTKEER